MLFYIDKKFGFKEAYFLTVLIIGLYFLVSGVLLFFTSSTKYKNNKFIGLNDSNQKISVSTWTYKCEPLYNIKITLNDDENVSLETKIEFMKVFDSFGYYKQDETTTFLKKELEKLNKKSL